MKYFVSRITKEHVPAHRALPWVKDEDGWDIVQADSEGWIAHTGDECPLPDDVWCEIKCSDNSQSKSPLKAGFWRWNDKGLKFYRPILTKQAETVQEPDPVVKDSLTTDLLQRLQAAHDAAQIIPDLEAELREVLGSMGYDLVYRNPFVEPADSTAVIAKSNVAVEAEQDMTDWRNWREGDELICVRPLTGCLSEGEKYVISEEPSGDYVGIIVQGNFTSSSFRPNRFRFHSRPAKGGGVMAYDAERIAQELEQTAQGYAYYGNSLYVAMDIPVADEADKQMLHRYLQGSELLTDRYVLQQLAIKIRQRHGAQGE